MLTTKPLLLIFLFVLNSNVPQGVAFDPFDRFVFNFRAPADNATTVEERQGAGFIFPTPPPGSSPRPGAGPGPTPAVAGFVIDTKDVDFAPCPHKPSCPIEGTKIYRPDGSCNNPIDGSRGAAEQPMKRLLPPDYADGRGKPRISVNTIPLPSARKVSNGMQDTTIQRSSKFSQLLPFWGQYIDHDMGSTPSSQRSTGVNCFCGNRDPACFNIPLGVQDIQFQREQRQCLPLVRSLPVPDCHCSTKVRQQRNEITSYLDAGTVYGNNDKHYRQMQDPNSPIGKLVTGNLRDHGISIPRESPVLPLTSQIDDNDAAKFMACPRAIHKPANVPCFFAGDERANEVPSLTSLHTLFLRLHNDLVERLSRLNPVWGRTKLIEEARKIVAALHQQITYREFLPIILGQTYMKRFGLELTQQGYWKGYDPSYDATLANAFSTAAFRFGHTLVSETFVPYLPSWHRAGPSLALRNSFFNTEPILFHNGDGANQIIRGITTESSLTFDSTFSQDMQNFLFAPTGTFGHDLLSINIQRGRDHGIPSYNEWRQLAGLRKATTFDDFIEIPIDRRNRLRNLYNNAVDNVDLYIGAISERSVPGGVVGPTFAYIIGHQFRDLKRGDRFWYENGDDQTFFTPEQLQAIRRINLANLICDQMKTTRSIQPNPFLQTTTPGNSRQPCSSYGHFDLSAWDQNGFQRPVTGSPSFEWTQYFPLNIGKEDKKLDPIGLMDHLKLNRPDDVCTRPTGSETRTVNGRQQIRFRCPPGSLKSTVYPPADVKIGRWTEWEDRSTPGRDDDESRGPTHRCLSPIAIQVQTLRGQPASETGNVFAKFGVFSGFLCRGKDQRSRRCRDYRVRYLCREIRSGPLKDDPVDPPKPCRPTPPTPPTPTRPSVPAGFRWTRWSNQGNPSPVTFGDDQEFLFYVGSTVGFCPNPVNIEVREVGTRIPAAATGDSILIMNREQGFYCQGASQLIRQTCRNYEVRYLCRISDIVRRPPVFGFPGV